MKHGNFHFDKPVIVSPWTLHLSLHKADVQSAAVFMQLHDFPLKYQNLEVLGRLVSQLGIRLMLDTLTQQRIKVILCVCLLILRLRKGLSKLCVIGMNWVDS